MNFSTIDKSDIYFCRESFNLSLPESLERHKYLMVYVKDLCIEDFVDILHFYYIFFYIKKVPSDAHSSKDGVDKKGGIMRIVQR